MERRQYLHCFSLVGATLAAGCTGSGDGPDDEAPADSEDNGDASTDAPSTDAPDDSGGVATGIVGERIEGSNLAMVAREVEEVDQLGQFSEPDSGNVFTVVKLAIKNTTDSEFADFSTLLQTRLVDDEDYTYSQSITASTGRDLNAGQIAPGEVIRGDIVFEVPEDATGLKLEFDFEAFAFSNFDRIQIDLAESASSPADLTQNLAVPIHGIGDAVERNDVTVEVNGIETETELGQFTSADEGNEYAIVDVSVTNETAEEQNVSILLQMMLKDGDGFGYTLDLSGYSALDQSFDQGNPIAAGQTRRGKIAYQIPEGTSPLYWAFEFEAFISGDKTFWQLR